MDTLSNAGLGARRNEDIALDLMKFVAGTAGVGKPAVPSTGFTGQGAAKPEEHVNQLLALYSRCLKAVEGKGRGERGGEIGRGRQLRVAVAGAGAFGRNHLRVVRELEAAGADAAGRGVALVAAVDPDAARAEEAAKQYGIPVFATIDELLKADLKLDAACVAVPTVKHHEVAAALLDAGLDLLVEKPLAANLAEADDLIRMPRKKRADSAAGTPGAVQSGGAGGGAEAEAAHVL